MGIIVGIISQAGIRMVQECGPELKRTISGTLLANGADEIDRKSIVSENEPEHRV